MNLKDLIALQKSIYDGYVNMARNVLGMYIIAIGWIVTSDNAREFLGQHGMIKISCSIVVLLILAIQLTILTMTMLQSDNLYLSIDRSKFSIDATSSEPQNHDQVSIEIFHIKPHYLLISGTLVSSLAILLSFMIWQLGNCNK